jgi:hypothetical protein
MMLTRSTAYWTAIAPLDYEKSDWDNKRGGTVNFDYPISFMLLASAEVKGRSGGPRAALGLVLADSRRGRDHQRYKRVGIFVCKGTNDFGGLKMFDDLRVEVVPVS